MTRHLLILSLILYAACAGNTAAGQSPADPHRFGMRRQALPPAQPGGSNAPAEAAPAPAPAHNDSFGTRLGANVGLRAVPPVAVIRGTRNINRPGMPLPLPGMQPLPLTPQPSPADPFASPFGGYRDINNPGGATAPRGIWPSPEGHGLGWAPDADDRVIGRDGARDQRHRPPHGYAPVYYLLPYYIPYVVSTTGAETQPKVATPNQPGGIAAQPLPQPGPYGSVTSSSGASAIPASGTLLAFKDHTIVLVKAYWLEGETVWYETADGPRTPIAISQLDFALTQQLNRERNVKFVLESR